MGDSTNSSFLSIEKPAVEFLNILDEYPDNEDLICRYKITSYMPQEGDRIAIFQFGWNSVKDYYVFEWVPLNDANENVRTVVFNKHILPKNSMDIFQICYINSDNQLQGATTPFQLCSSTNAMSQTNIWNRQAESDEITKLRNQNAILWESLQAVIAQKKGKLDHSDELKELKLVTEKLQSSLKEKECEIDTLRQQLVDAELLCKNMYIAKMDIEKNLEALVKSAQKTGDDDSFDLGEFIPIPPFPFPQ